MTAECENLVVSCLRRIRGKTRDLETLVNLSTDMLRRMHAEVVRQSVLRCARHEACVCQWCHSVDKEHNLGCRVITAQAAIDCWASMAHAERVEFAQEYATG